MLKYLFTIILMMCIGCTIPTKSNPKYDTYVITYYMHHQYGPDDPNAITMIKCQCSVHPKAIYTAEAVEIVPYQGWVPVLTLHKDAIVLSIVKE